MGTKKEIWQPIPGSPGYWASNFGQIKSKYRIRKLQITQTGYAVVRIPVNKVYKLCRVNRLVLLSFKGKSNKLALHKDGDKLNNCLSNLYYGTLKDIQLPRSFTKGI